MQPLTPLDRALEYYLEVRTGDLRADLIAAAQEAARRRREGPEMTRLILRAMKQRLDMSYRDIEEASYNERYDARISRSAAERLIRGDGT